MGNVQIKIEKEFELEPGDYLIRMDDDFDQSAVLGSFQVDHEVGTQVVCLNDIRSTGQLPQDAEKRLNLIDKLSRLKPFELRIIEVQIDRLLMGQHDYGEWQEDDDRDMRKEALEEALDMSQYLSAALLREGE